MSKPKILHIFANSGAYPNKFVPDLAVLLERISGDVDNKFIVLGDDSNLHSRFKYFVFLTSLKSMLKLVFFSRGVDKIVFHSIASRYLIVFLLFHKIASKKSKYYLVLWGGEVHFLNTNTWRNRLAIILNGYFMSKMHGFITYIKQDFDLAVKLSGNTKSEWINIQSVYPSNVVDSSFDRVSRHECRIMIGCSALKGNRHKDIIDLVASSNISETAEFIFPLSYGSRDYAEEIILYARGKIKGKVTPLYDFVSIGEYRQMLSTVNVALFMHDGQQGMGNIRNLIYFGAAVYLKKNSVSYEYFSDAGFKVFDIEKDIIEPSITLLEDNISNAAEVFSERLLVEQIRDFLVST